jgi:hypothetical protein
MEAYMKRMAAVLSLACAYALTLPAHARAQAPAAIAGKWDITVRMPDRSATEQWTIQQKGKAITATAKGERELPVSGSLDGAFLRVTVKDADKEYKVRATVDGNEMDGSITYGPGKEYLWHAKRPKAK